jgi:hypothetical protein
VTEDSATVSRAVARLLEVRYPGQPVELEEIRAVRSATRRILEANLAHDDEQRLLRAVAGAAAHAALPMWALDAIVTELREPQLEPVPPLTWERAQRRLRQQGADTCPICMTHVATEFDLERVERQRVWNGEAREVHRGAVEVAG